MQLSIKPGMVQRHMLLIAVFVFALAIIAAGPALAGADTTFNTAFNKFSGFLEGSGGKIITLISLALGIAAMASGRFAMGQIALPVGVGIAVGTGVPIVTSTITAII
jgi:conjugal transfer pilus assembly protein TraA